MLAASEPTLGGKLLHEGAALRRVAELGKVLAMVVHYDRVVVFHEPGVDLLSKFLFFGGEIEIHRVCSSDPCV